MVGTGAPAWAESYREQNEKAAALGRAVPDRKCPRCQEPLGHAKGICDRCRRADWCPTCGESLLMTHTRRCERCGAPAASPFCGAGLKPDAFAACPACGAPVTCRACGYELTGNVSGRCPECGADATPRVLAPGVWPPQTERHARQDRIAVAIGLTVTSILFVFLAMSFVGILLWLATTCMAGRVVPF